MAYPQRVPFSIHKFTSDPNDQCWLFVAWFNHLVKIHHKKMSTAALMAFVRNEFMKAQNTPSLKEYFASNVLNIGVFTEGYESLIILQIICDDQDLCDFFTINDLGRMEDPEGGLFPRVGSGFKDAFHFFYMTRYFLDFAIMGYRPYRYVFDTFPNGPIAGEYIPKDSLVLNVSALCDALLARQGFFVLRSQLRCPASDYITFHKMAFTRLPGSLLFFEPYSGFYHFESDEQFRTWFCDEAEKVDGALGFLTTTVQLVGDWSQAQTTEVICFPYEDYCFRCGKTEEQLKVEGKKLLCCGRCKVAIYCGADCQRAHWPIHKLACMDDIITRFKLTSPT